MFQGAGSENPADNYKGNNDTGAGEANSGGLLGKVKAALGR